MNPSRLPNIHYRIALSDPAAHTLHVTLTIATPASAGQVLRLPAWIPGSYMVREFAKNIHAISAECGGKSVKLTQLDKHSWQAAPCKAALTVTCEVYAFDLSVRAAYFDAQQALLNFSSLCLAVVGQENSPCTLEIAPPAHAPDWQVATSLPRVKNAAGALTAHKAFGCFQAPNYDALIDHPMQLGRMAWGQFKAHGARHDIAIAGRMQSLDMPRLVADTTAICAAQIALFEPSTRTAPFLDSADRYTFMTLAVGDGYGGLEHRASTALIANRSDLPSTLDASLSAGYQQYLGLVSHEYFHTWNVKRIKPAVFAPYELAQESYTPLLWLFEGFTAYYDDLMLRRAGVTTRQQYLTTLATTMSGVRRGAGRLRQSAADASFNAWVKYYRQDEHSPNVLCNYYTQGNLIAAYLDLHIRHATQHTRSLDDVMRLLWVQFGRDFYKTGAGKGVTLNDVYAAFDAAAGLKLKPLIQKLTLQAADVPLAPLLAKFGIATHFEASNPTASLGVRTAAQGNELKITTAFTGEAAHRAGLSGGDVLVALDGLRVTPASLPTLLARCPAGSTLRVLAWRRDELIESQLTLDAAPKTQVSLQVKKPNAGLAAWLGK